MNRKRGVPLSQLQPITIAPRKLTDDLLARPSTWFRSSGWCQRDAFSIATAMLPELMPLVRADATESGEVAGGINGAPMVLIQLPTSNRYLRP